MLLGMGQAPVVSAAPAPSPTGFPANYPYAVSAPLPSAILRPLQQPLYDTELLDAGATPAEVRFFQRQIGQTSIGAPAITKSSAETNLGQPGQLANPLEFSLFGFNFMLGNSRAAFVGGAEFLLLADFNSVYLDSAFTFLYTGNRIYLQIPLNRIPSGVAAEGFSSADAQAAPVERTVVHNGVGHISNFYKFTIGRSALRMRPTESFQVRLEWPNGAPAITNDLRMNVFLTGLQWTPL